jgi:hypothetical protein
MSLEPPIVFLHGMSKNDKITMERDKLREQVNAIRTVLRRYRKHQVHRPMERPRSSLRDSQEGNPFRVEFGPMNSETAIVKISEVLRR